MDDRARGRVQKHITYLERNHARRNDAAALRRALEGQTNDLDRARLRRYGQALDRLGRQTLADIIYRLAGWA